MVGRRAEEVLDLPTDAAPYEVRRAFRRFVRLHHPDVGGDRRHFERGMRAYEELVRRSAGPTPIFFENSVRAQLARWVLRHARRLGMRPPRVQ